MKFEIDPLRAAQRDLLADYLRRRYGKEPTLKLWDSQSPIQKRHWLQEADALFRRLEEIGVEV
jgi:hypothetical protein